MPSSDVGNGDAVPQQRYHANRGARVMVTIRWMRVLAFTAACVIVLAACGDADSGSDQAEGSEPYDVFALLPQGNDQPYGATYLPPFKSEADEVGLNLTITNSQYNAGTQLSNCEAAVASQPDAIILWPAVAETVLPCLDDANDADIPVIITNSDVLDEDTSLTEAFSGPDTYGQGAVSAELFCEFAGGEEIGILMVNGLTGNTTAIDREAGFEETITEQCPNVTILSRQPGNWNKDESQFVTSEMLTEVGPDNVGGVWAADDTMVAGAIDALKARGIDPEPLVITSIGNTELGHPLVKSGELDGTVDQSSSWDGEHAASVTHDIITGQHPDRVLELMPNTKVTQENVDDPELEPEW